MSMPAPTSTQDRVEPAPMLARSIGRYRLCFELASGGMGKVFLARTEGAGGIRKLVAVKTIHSHLSGEHAFVEMFLDEARIASQISHPNVCSVFDVGVDGDAHFLAMELLVGEPLSRVFRRLARAPEERSDPLFPAVAARIVAETCAGLHAAHELRGARGEPLEVVHRDVSPQNIFLNYDGSVRVVDFGIARAAGRMTSTGTGVIKGKFSYIAPEGLEHRLWDRKTDIWAAGVVLWELLVGRKLFTGEGEAQVLMSVLRTPIPAPSAAGARCPPQLDEIVLRALARDAAARYPSAREFERDLQRFCVVHTGGEPLGAPELGAWMERLFPTERSRWQEVVDQARAGGDGVPRVSSRLRSDVETPSDIAIDLSVDEERTGARPTEAARQATEAPAEGPATRRRAPFAAGALLLVGGSVAWGIAARRADEPADRGALGAASLREPGPPRGVLAVPVVAAGPSASSATEPDDAPGRVGASTDTTPAAVVAVAGSGPSQPMRPDVREERPRPVSSRTRARPADPAPVASGEPGTLTIATPGGWADVFEGGRPVGRAPGRLTLPGGRHRLELRFFGTEPVRRVDVSVPAGGSARVLVEASE